MSSETTVDRSVWIQVPVALFFWGSVPVIVRGIEAEPFTIGVERLSVATLLVGLILLRWEELRRLRRSDVWGLAAIGGSFAAHWALYFFSIKTSSASIGAIGLASYGVQLLLLQSLVYRQRLRRIDLLAVSLGVGGSILIIPEFSLQDNVTAGILLGVVSSFFFAVLPLLHRAYSHLSTSMRTFGQFAFGFLAFAVFLPWTRWELQPLDWLGLAYLTIFCTFVSHTMWVRVTTALEPATTSTIYYIYLPVSLGFAAVLLGERLDLRTLAGACLVVAGSIIGIRNQLRRDRRPPASQ